MSTNTKKGKNEPVTFDGFGEGAYNVIRRLHEEAIARKKRNGAVKKARNKQSEKDGK